MPTEKLSKVGNDWNLMEEVRNIQKCARKRLVKAVVVSNFVLFSTPTRDALLLDDQGFAAVLTINGQNNPYLHIDESDDREIRVGMDGMYEWLDDSTLVLRDEDGKVIKAFENLMGMRNQLEKSMQMVQDANKSGIIPTKGKPWYMRSALAPSTAKRKDLKQSLDLMDESEPSKWIQ